MMRNLWRILCIVLSLPVFGWEVATGSRPTDRTAAAEFSRIAAGAADTVSVNGVPVNHIDIGETAAARAMGYGAEQFAIDEYCIDAAGDRLVITGGSRGVLYGVFHFFEKYAGCRFWSPLENDLPGRQAVNITGLPEKGSFYFELRDIYRTALPKDEGRAAVARGLSRNGDDGISGTYGGEFSYGPPYFCHTFDLILPAAEYLEPHPEYFSLVGGTRTGGQLTGQLCLTNPEMRQEFLRRLLQNIERGNAESAAAGVPAPTIYDVSQNDNQNSCRCDECAAFVREAGESGLLLDFINELAAAVQKEHPAVKLQTFAYLYTLEPPRNDIKPAPGVIVRLCNTDSNQVTGAAANPRFQRYLKAWSERTENVYIWDYAIIFQERVTGLPFPSEFSYPATYRLYADHHVRGVFWEQEEADIADMADLKYYLHSKYMQNPYRDDFEELFRDFMTHYYGEAGEYIAGYRRLLAAKATQGNLQLSWFPQTVDFCYIDPETMSAIQELFEKARYAVAPDAERLFRVNRCAMGIDRLAGFELPWYYAQSSVDLEAARNRFETTWRECRKRGWLPKNQDAILTRLKRNVAMQKTILSPDEFAAAPCWYFPGSLIECMTPQAQIQSDPHSRNESVLAITLSRTENAEAGDFLEFNAGIYDYTARQEIMRESFSVPGDDQYRWYTFRLGQLPHSPTRMYLGSDWSVQLSLGFIGSLSRDGELTAHIRMKGIISPSTDQGAGSDMIPIDQIVLTEKKQ